MNSARKRKADAAVEMKKIGIETRKANDGTVVLDKAAEEYEMIKNMKLSDLVEKVIAWRKADEKDLSITSNRIDLMSKVVKNAIVLMHRNGANELSVKIKGDVIEMAFRCEADNIALSSLSYCHPYLVENVLSKSKKKVTVDLKKAR